MLKIFIADDEPLALRRLELAIARVPETEIVGRSTNGAHALSVIQSTQPDLVILDIDMPGLSGLELASALGRAGSAAVVFLTAHDRFAVEAFNAAAVDYLLKPLDEARLRVAIERARALAEARAGAARAVQLEDMLNSAPTREPPSVAPAKLGFWVSHRSETIRVSIDDIVWFGVDGDYVIIHTAAAEYLVHESLARLETRLGGEFMRAHRNAVIRMTAIVAIDRTKPGRLSVRLANGDLVPVSRPYQRKIAQLAR